MVWNVKRHRIRSIKKTIIELCKERAYIPTIHDILDKTKTVKNNYYLSILEQIKKDGYFRLGVVHYHQNKRIETMVNPLDG